MLLGTVLFLIGDYLHYVKGIGVVTWREIKQPALPETWNVLVNPRHLEANLLKIATSRATPHLLKLEPPIAGLR